MQIPVVLEKGRLALDILFKDCVIKGVQEPQGSLGRAMVSLPKWRRTVSVGLAKQAANARRSLHKRLPVANCVRIGSFKNSECGYRGLHDQNGNIKAALIHCE